MSDFFKLLLTALLGAAVYPTIKKVLPEFALLLSVGTVCVFLYKLLERITTILEGLKSWQERLGGDSFSCLLRASAILLLSDYMKTFCREAGAESVSWCVEWMGRCFVLAAAWPLFQEIMRTMGELTR